MTGATPAPAPRRRLKPEQRREEILDAASTVLLDAGIEALTMEALAAAARVNRAVPYYYFSSREGVLVALVDREFDRLAAAMVIAAAADGATFAVRLRRVIEVWLDYADAQACLAVVNLVESPTGELADARTRHRVAAATFFVAFLREDHDLGESEALVLSATLMGGSQGLIPAWQATRWSRRRLVDTYVAICQGAIAAVIEARPPARARSRTPSR